jgi:hypothetical protein
MHVSEQEENDTFLLNQQEKSQCICNYYALNFILRLQLTH